MPAAGGAPRFRNRNPWALWIFMALWMVGLVVTTWIFVADGLPSGTTLVMLGVGWLGSLGASVWVARQQVLCVDVDATGGLDIMWYSPTGVRRRRIESAQVPAAVVVEGRDDEGDPYFRCRVTLADGTRLDLAEAYARDPVQHAANCFNAGRRR